MLREKQLENEKRTFFFISLTCTTIKKHPKSSLQYSLIFGPAIDLKYSLIFGNVLGLAQAYIG